jgi:hypothetical protein
MERLVCATNRDLIEEQNRGRFRRDLYYRIASWTGRLPPLRERREDIPLIATRESGAPDFYKQALLKAGSDATTVTDKFTGMYARVLRNAFTEEYESSGAPVFPPFFQFLAMGDIVKAATEKGSGEYFPNSL